MQNRIKVVLIGTPETKRKFMEKLDKELGLIETQNLQLKSIIGVDFVVRHSNNIEFQIWDMIGQRFNHMYSSRYFKDADAIIFTSPEHDKEKLLENNSNVMTSNVLVIEYNAYESALAYLKNIEENKNQVTITPKRSSITYDDYKPQDMKVSSKQSDKSSPKSTVTVVAQQEPVGGNNPIYSNSFLFSHIDSLSLKKKQEKEIDEIFTPQTNLKK